MATPLAKKATARQRMDMMRTPRFEPPPHPEVLERERAAAEAAKNQPPREYKPAIMSDSEIDSLFRAVPQLAALDRLCAAAREGTTLSPVWTVGPIAAHFVGRNASEIFEEWAWQEDRGARPGDAHDQQTADRWRLTDGAFHSVVRRLAGMERDEPFVVRDGTDKCSPLLLVGWAPQIPFAMGYPPQQAHSHEVERAAEDFVPARDVKWLSGPAACLAEIGSHVFPAHEFLSDFRSVAATLFGGKQWAIQPGWERGGLFIQPPYRYGYVGHQALRLMKYPAALELFVRDFAYEPKEPAAG